MNYDTSISTEVSLSKVLDEMILDGTDLEIIVTFLESHESQIEDIYKHSAFVYDLYDLAAHPYRVNDFLARHIYALPKADMCFAAESLANFLCQEEYRPDLMRELRTMLHGNADVVRFRSVGYRGRYAEDAKVASGDLDLSKLVEAIAADDKRTVRVFLQESYLGRSMLMAENFLGFSPKAQFMILSALGDTLNPRYQRGATWMPLAHATNNLLKQLLMMNETDTFNWVANVLGITNNGRISNHVVESLWGDAFERLPKMLGERFGKELNSFEEVVFEMNMMETQFDVLDLFIYVYVFDPGLFKGMREATELFEFFSLPFKWEELEKFNPEWGRRK